MVIGCDTAMNCGSATRDSASPNPQGIGSWCRCGIFAIFALILCSALSGCVSVPPAREDHGSSRERLSAHVAFLSQPDLKGREPRTRGSRLAREYIEDRFKACNLISWQQSQSYELPFGFGRNVVGVLPGSDTNLSRQFVLLSAHYDHLGKKHGKIYRGAADNASGIAALLETARQVSQSPHRPKRSIVFAAFDCEEEMLLGSMAFTCREDVRRTNIFAVVNVDMLGRSLLDVVSNTVFIAGTKDYPGLREQVRQFGAKDGLNVLPIGADLIGPRGDHASFESWGMPCLFFTCGIFRDYHEPTDTPDKLNYGEIKRSAQVILQTVQTLADAGELKPATNTSTGDLGELRTVTTVFDQVLEHGKEAGIETNDLAVFQQLKGRANQILASGHYDRQTRQDLILSATGALGAYLVSPEDMGKMSDTNQQQMMRAGLEFMEFAYLNHRNEMMDGYRKLVAQLVKYRPGPFRTMPKFQFEIYDLDDDNTCLRESAPGIFQLNALAYQMTIDAQVKRSIWLVNSFGGSFGLSLNALHCVGHRQQVTDYCLLLLRDCRTNNVKTEELMKLYRLAAGTTATNGYQELLSWRLAQGGFNSETAWLTNCILSDAPALAMLALENAGDCSTQWVADAARAVLADVTRRADVRAQAIQYFAGVKSKSGLLAICDVLNDGTPYDPPEYDPFLARDGFFSDLTIIKSMRSLAESQYKTGKEPKTIGALARKQLKKATGNDFGNDVARWRGWIGRNA